MKLNKVLPMLAVATFALAACAPKVDYDKFHEKAAAAAKEDPGYKKVTIKGEESGKIGGASISYKFDHVAEKKDGDWKITKGDDGYDYQMMLAGLFLDQASLVQKMDDTEYYAGSTFKVVVKDGDDKLTKTYDKYGYFTSAKGKGDGMEVDVKVTWSK